MTSKKLYNMLQTFPQLRMKNLVSSETLWSLLVIAGESLYVYIEIHLKLGNSRGTVSVQVWAFGK